jgi:asparagine synthase (glutamine-hydrolysing)
MTQIAGIIRKVWNEEATHDLENMRASMLREPSETSGTWIRESIGLGLVWACRPQRFIDPVPSRNDAGDISLFFCGETFAETKEPEDLIGLYERAGDTFFEHLNGGFCGILVDFRANRIVLFNDRYGTRRIYWHESQDDFRFASQAKSLLEVEPRMRQLDARGLGEFLSCGCVLQNRTLFSGISILPAGARWTFHPGGKCERGTYFHQKTWEALPRLDPSEFAGRLGETLARVVPLYLRDPDDIGISLTGGVDSRLLIALATPSQRTLSCYTFASPDAESADVRLARQVASICGLEHQTIPVADEFLRQFPALAEQTVLLSDGAMDVSGAVELYVNQRAREIAPIRLTGNYGSEVLRSYVAFVPRPLDATLFDSELAQHLRHAEATYGGERRCRTISFIAFKQVAWHHFARSAIEQSQVTMRSPYLDNEVVKLAYQAPGDAAADTTSLLELAVAHNAALRRIATDRAIRVDPLPLVSRIARLYQEVAVRAEYAYDYGMPQWLAQLDYRLARLRLERLFLGRHKFYHFRLWYRAALANFVRAILLDPRARQRPYLDGRRVQEIVELHTSGKGNYTVEIHKLLTLELLQRLLLDRN